MQKKTTVLCSTEKKPKYPPPCKIVDNVVVSDEAPLFEECLSLGELLFEKLNSNPDFVGQINSITDERMTFAEIKGRAVRCALWLQNRGVQRGDVIGMSTHNHSDCSAPLLGSLFICAPFYPMHYKLSIDDSRYFLSLVKPKVVFVNADMVETMAKAAQEEDLAIQFVTFGYAEGFQSFQEIIEEEQNAAAIDEFRCTRISSLEETAMLFLSSGTTGPCKAVMISYRALINNLHCGHIAMNQKVVMWFNTMRWINGTTLMLRSMYFCKTQIICDKYEEELTCKLIEKYNVAWAFFLPGLIVNILKNGLLQKYRLSSLKNMILGGAVMRPHLQEALIKALPHTEIIFAYGMSELCGVATAQRQGDKIGSIGYVLRNTQLKVIDIVTGKTLGPNETGEFLWKSPYVMTGYYNNPQATKKVLDEDGWLHSGDVGYYDENGEIYICDRVAETIRVSGVPVHPSEIESVLQSHPAVREVAVVRILNDNDITSECPFAFVSKIPDAEVTAEELIKLVADNLEDYKHLRGGVQFLDELPHTDTGKIARKQLKELAKRFVSDCVPAEYIQNN